MITAFFRERNSLFSPLGIRFWDPAYNAPVSDGLLVCAEPEKGGNTPVKAVLTRSGNYAFGCLPGLAAQIFQNEERIPLPSVKKKFIIRISDTKGRFLPHIFKIELPLAEKGLFPLNMHLSGAGIFPEDSLSSLSADPGNTTVQHPGFYLFSAPARQVPYGMGVVRADLKNVTEQTPACYALMELHVKDTKYYGISDKDGKVAVLFPYPVFASTLSGSPFVVSGLDPQTQTWPVSVRIYNSPGDLLFYKNIDIPCIKSIFGQKPVKIVTGLSPLAEADESIFTLHFNQELILKTNGLSELCIREGGS